MANQTALADAELEYQDVTDPSVYVEFPVEPTTAGNAAGANGFVNAVNNIINASVVTSTGPNPSATPIPGCSHPR